MTKSELQEQLEAAKVSPYAYSLDGGMWDDRYVLSQEPGGKWSVYYSERGRRNNQRFFSTEHKACEFFLAKLLNDPSTRMK
jgi:hypothetical protein